MGSPLLRSDPPAASTSLLPALGDFASRRLPAGMLDRWHDWIASGLVASRSALGDHWIERYESAPAMAFLVAPGLLDARAWTGVMMASADRVGRRFPLMVAVPAGFDYAAAVGRGARLKVATKYLDTARKHFAQKGVHVDLIKLYGSMELAPLTGLADAIVDLVSTGNTLRANNLVAVEEIAPISARLIVNRAAMNLKRDGIQALVDAFGKAVPGRA